MTAGSVGVVHVHSNYSHDGRDSLDRLRDFALERGISFVGLTDHAEDFGAEKYLEYIMHCKHLSNGPVRLIPGLEFRFSGYPGLHLLALGLTRWIEPQTPRQFIEQSAGAAGFTIVAHPLLPGYQIPPEVRAGIDAIEVWNASYNTRYLPDPMAIRLLHEIRQMRPEVVGTAGLDQHDARNDRRTRVVLTGPDGEAPLAALKAGRFYNRGLTMSFGAAVPWPPLAVSGLATVRWLYDRVERIQERIARELHG
jgi:PHP domain